MRYNLSVRYIESICIFRIIIKYEKTAYEKTNAIILIIYVL